MSFNDFIAALTPVENPISHHNQELLDQLRNLNPEIYWYPGSGKDYTPLMLDAPNNPTGRRLFRNNASDDHPLLLWMTDINGMDPRYGLGYQSVEELYSSAASVHPKIKIEQYMCGDIYVLLFAAHVRNSNQGKYSRPADGDDYIVIFTGCDAIDNFHSIFEKYNIDISVISLIKQKNLYKDVPEIVRNSKVVNDVDFWIVDQSGVDDLINTFPELQYIGGPVPWGRVAARLFARNSVNYNREDRMDRIGNSWRSN
jgi:hypothetical protein